MSEGSTNILQQATEATPPSGYLDYRLFLAGLYEFAKQRSAGYSFKALAADLGFGPTTVMHQIVRGRRPLTSKAAEKVVKALALKGTERRYFLAMVAYGNAKGTARREELFEELLALKSGLLPSEAEQDVLEYFSEWYHPVIRELVGTRTFQSDPAWIAARIVPRLRPEQARASLALLERLGLVAFDAETGRHVQTQKRVTTGPRVKGLALVRYHQKMIELGREALTRVTGKRRDVSAITVNVDEATAQRLKALVHAFQTQLLDAAERGPGNEIYQVNIQLFPFTDARKDATDEEDEP